MAKVVAVVLFNLINDTISYFYLGETLQQSTDSQSLVISIISYAISFSKPWIRASPVMIKAFFLV